MNTLKDQILELRAQGKTYQQIIDELGCAKSTVSYYCSETERENTKKRQEKRRTDPLLVKKETFQFQPNPESKIYSRNNVNGFISQKVTNYSEGSRSSINFTMQELRDKLLQDGAVCYLSGRNIDLTDPASYSFDHIIPRAAGGSNSLENLGLSTREANAAKSNMQLDYFLDLCKDILVNKGYEVNKI